MDISFEKQYDSTAKELQIIFTKVWEKKAVAVLYHRVVYLLTKNKNQHSGHLTYINLLKTAVINRSKNIICFM